MCGEIFVFQDKEKLTHKDFRLYELYCSFGKEKWANI